MFTSVVLSLLLQRETGTEIIRSQGSIGFLEKEEDDGNLRPEAERILGVTGSVLHP